jgi:serine/threonine protein kinase
VAVYVFATEATLRLAVWKVMWLVVAVAVATACSRVIYGLRREVRLARRLGQYTLEEKLGEGGMGVVYRARHALLRRPTAVKLLKGERLGEASLRRFEREVLLTASLSHPNTVSVYDFGRTPDGVFYYAMEYLEGLSLEQLVAEEGAQPPGRVVHVLRQVLGALAEAHGVGLVHRDVKPDNVILCERGGLSDVAKVVDFGLVKDLDAADALSHEGMLVGTPLYLAPEAIRSPDTDPRADLYSLGAVAYFLLTGKHVFRRAHDHRDLRPPPAHPARTAVSAAGPPGPRGPRKLGPFLPGEEPRRAAEHGHGGGRGPRAVHRRGGLDAGDGSLVRPLLAASLRRDPRAHARDRGRACRGASACAPQG